MFNNISNNLFKRIIYKWPKVSYSTNLNCNNSSISRQLISKIKVFGPITVAEYMKDVLINPLAGYYMHRDVFGAKGDFITSPELSQMFGELLAVWFINEWSKAGSPKPLHIVELGPGRGTLCQDILRIFAHFKLLDKVSVHLVEVSPHLTKVQADTLCTHVEQKDGDLCFQWGETVFGVPVFWYKHLEHVPREFTLYLAHEFFDALPIHQFKKTPEGYREILIDIDPLKEGQFRYVLANKESPIGKYFIAYNETRAFIEVCPEGLLLANKIGKWIETHGGLALIIDYGHEGKGIDSFRAFKNHKLHNPLIGPGTADLTADVDFNALKKMAASENEVLTFGPITQREFLIKMGIEYRMNKLREVAKKAEIEGLEYSYRMLIDPDKMGERFKVLAIVPSSLQVILNKHPLCGFF